MEDFKQRICLGLNDGSKSLVERLKEQTFYQIDKQIAEDGSISYIINIGDLLITIEEYKNGEAAERRYRELMPFAKENDTVLLITASGSNERKIVNNLRDLAKELELKGLWDNKYLEKQFGIKRKLDFN